MILKWGCCKTFTGIAFITSNKSNSNLFYIKEIQHFTCNNFYYCCINSRLLIFSTANKNLYKKNRGFATFYEVLQQPVFLSEEKEYNRIPPFLLNFPAVFKEYPGNTIGSTGRNKIVGHSKIFPEKSTCLFYGNFRFFA